MNKLKFERSQRIGMLEIVCDSFETLKQLQRLINTDVVTYTPIRKKSQLYRRLYRDDNNQISLMWKLWWKIEKEF